jgi:hypothetical protein
MSSTVTYSPEDNKLRLYVGRVPRDEYERLRKAGFISTPKQDCDFVATWSTSREDLASEYLEDDEEIGDEDYSPLERSADRAERFEGYREKRTGEAVDLADTHAAGPSVFGHQNRDRAERQARRHDRIKGRALGQWSKAEYWQTRTAGVIAHALHKASPRVRRGRIDVLEAELRKETAGIEEEKLLYRRWLKVLELEGLDERLTLGREEFDNCKPAVKAAYHLANRYGSGCWYYKHPRIDDLTTSLYSLLTHSVDPITAGEAAELFFKNNRDPDNEMNSTHRYKRHLELRLGYERAMLANEGGAAAEVEMIPGGWIRAGTRTGSVFTHVAGGWMQIHAITKSSVTKKPTSVKVMGRLGCNETVPGLVSIDIKRLGEDAYRAPTEEELAKFHEETKARKAKIKATAPKEPPLLNPTDEDALKLQAIWNASERGDPKQVVSMTQAQYTARSKGSYSHYQSSDVTEKGLVRRDTHFEGSRSGRKIVFKVRTHGFPRGVVIISDKPRKPLPWAEMELIKQAMPSPERMIPKLQDLYKACASNWYPRKDPEALALIEDAIYLGWAYHQSESQFGLTDAGMKIYREHCCTTTQPQEIPCHHPASEASAA